MTHSEASTTMNLAIGRLFRICSRPFQEGDHEQYEAVRSAVFEAAETLGLSTSPGWRPDWVRDRMKGAAGD